MRACLVGWCSLITINSIGGTMVIHMFGAAFGLALSMVLSPDAASKPSTSLDNAAVYHSDVMAMVCYCCAIKHNLNRLM
jgi:hypothetical protein